MTRRGTATAVIVVVAAVCLIALILGLAIGLNPDVKNKKDSTQTIQHPINVGKQPSVTERSTPQKTTDTSAMTVPATTASQPKRALSSSKDYRMAAVQSDRQDCSTIGMDIMVGKGGSAVDGGVATMICIGALNFHGSGIGGGHFSVIYEAPRGSRNKTVNTINARETFPMAGDQNFYVNKTNSPVLTGTAVGVPGELHGFYTAWQMYGRVPWAELIQPTIKLCEEGFPINKRLEYAINFRKDRISKPDHSLRSLLMKPDGTFYKEGELLKRPKFARTLRIIARDPYSFYNGTLADDIVADIQDAGGIITKEDLLRYKPRIRPPIYGRLPNLGLSMYSVEPPSSGVVLQFIMRILDGLQFNNESLKDTKTAIETYHKFVEAMKFGYGRRSALGDPDFYDLREVVKNMTDENFVRATRSKIDTSTTHKLDYYDHAYDIVDDAGTTHLNVLAPDGGAMAITASINYYFGSEVYGKRTGIMFNNEMDDFSIPGSINLYNISSSPSNYPAPGKMPMSSMSPTIYLSDDGKVAFLSGGSGGPRIISGSVYVAFHNLYLKLSLAEATDMARLHHQLLPHVLLYEDGFSMEILAGLENLKHEVKLLTSSSHIGSVRDSCVLCKDTDCPLVCVTAVGDGRADADSYGY